MPGVVAGPGHRDAGRARQQAAQELPDLCAVAQEEEQGEQHEEEAGDDLAERRAVTLFFFLRDGAQIWRFLCRLLPRPARVPVARAGHYSWHTLGSYVRATVLVAFVDAVGIGIGLAVLGVPLALPLAALVFLGAFIPVIGATLSGTVAILVALVTQGPVSALIVLGVVVAVQQLEGHVLQPLIMGRAVALHPLAVVLAIATGLVVAGIVGALVAVPLLAVANTAVRYLTEHPGGEPTPTGNRPAPDPSTTTRPKPNRPRTTPTSVSTREHRRRLRPPSTPTRGRRSAVPEPAHERRKARPATTPARVPHTQRVVTTCGNGRIVASWR